MPYWPRSEGLRYTGSDTADNKIVLMYNVDSKHGHLLLKRRSYHHPPSLISLLLPLIMDRVALAKQGDNALGSVCLSVRFHPHA